MGRSKAIGTWAESEVVKACKRAGLPAKRQVLAGANDQGDVHLPLGDELYVIEVKAGEQTRNPSWGQLDAWWAEAVTEAGNVEATDDDVEVVPLLIVRRWGSGRAEDWWCYYGNDDVSHGRVCCRFRDFLANARECEGLDPDFWTGK